MTVISVMPFDVYVCVCVYPFSRVHELTRFYISLSVTLLTHAKINPHIMICVRVFVEALELLCVLSFHVSFF